MSILEILTEALEAGMKAILFNDNWQAYESGTYWDDAIDYNGETLGDLKQEWIRKQYADQFEDQGEITDEEWTIERSEKLVGAWILDGNTFNILSTGHSKGTPRRDHDWENHNTMMLYFASQFAVKTITS